MVLRRLTDNELAVMSAIDANNKTIAQLRLTNQKLKALLPEQVYKRRGRVKDPRSGQNIQYQKKKKGQ